MANCFQAKATTKASTGTSTSDSLTTTAASPTTFVSTITQGGSVSLQTVTIMPTAAGTSETTSSAANVSTGQKGLSTGAAVGTAVGVLGFVVLVIAAGFYFWIRRKRRNQEGAMLEHQDSFRGSSAGMMGTPRTEMASVWEGEAQSVGRRSSRLMPHDPRMDPYTPNLYGRFDNKSHESINTLRDDQDYSRRVLRTTNPDQPAGE
jgi:LPXTG-motif cell wall-anchored protein